MYCEKDITSPSKAGWSIKEADCYYSCFYFNQLSKLKIEKDTTFFREALLFTTTDEIQDLRNVRNARAMKDSCINRCFSRIVRQLWKMNPVNF